MLLTGLLLGFLLPGYAAARKLCPEIKLPAAFLLSCLILFYTFFAFDLLRIPLRFATIAPALAILTLAIHLALRRLPPPPAPSSSLIRHPSSRFLLILIAALLALFLYRTALAPLRGPDTPFRWDYLATAIVHAGHFHFYPPRSPADFSHYFYPDGFPPLVSISYAWLYLSAGHHATRLTALLLTAQFAATLAFTARAAAALYRSPRAGARAAALLAGSPMLFHWTGIGQETGPFALATAALLYFLAAEKGMAAEKGTLTFSTPSPAPTAHRPSYILLAACATAYAANLREYGPAYIPIALAVAALLKIPPRRIVAFTIIATTLSAPWYLRNLVLTHNPVFSNRLLNFPVNPVHAAIMDWYATIYTPRNWTSNDWTALLKNLLINAPLVLPLSLAALVLALYRRTPIPRPSSETAKRSNSITPRPVTSFDVRHSPLGTPLALLLVAAAIAALFLASAPYTSGGKFYALRVLTPALVPLAILAAALGIDEPQCQRPSLLVTRYPLLIFLSLLYTLLYSFPFPLTPDRVRPAPGHAYPAAYWVAGTREVARPVNLAVAQYLHAHLGPHATVLTDNAYLPPVLNPLGIQTAPVWRPDLTFLFDPSLPPQLALQKLHDKGITHILYSPNYAGGQFLQHFPPFLPTPGHTTTLPDQSLLLTVP